MLRINADAYIQTGKAFAEARRFFDGGLFGSITTISDFHASILAKNLHAIGEQSVSLKLPVTAGLVDDFFLDYKDSLPTWTTAQTRFESIEKAFRKELQSRLFVFILPHRMGYYSDELQVGPEMAALISPLANKFPAAVYDLREAGNCFATERFTACVQHLAKIVEYGLVSFCTFAGSTDPLNWNKALNEANVHLRDRSGNFNGIGPMDEQYYAECIALLRNFKTAWRNPVSHIPEVFDEPKARGLFSIMQSTMDHLGKRFGQVPVPDRI